jgi:hypothetical protein
LANFMEIDEVRKVLGLSEAATLKEIKRDYRTLAHRHHQISIAVLLVRRPKNYEEIELGG